MTTIGTLTNLTALSFGLTRIATTLEPMAGLTKLKHLYMENCHFLKGTMEVFRSFQDIEMLELQNCWSVRILPTQPHQLPTAPAQQPTSPSHNPTIPQSHPNSTSPHPSGTR